MQPISGTVILVSQNHTSTTGRGRTPQQFPFVRNACFKHQNKKVKREGGGGRQASYHFENSLWVRGWNIKHENRGISFNNFLQEGGGGLSSQWS